MVVVGTGTVTTGTVQLQDSADGTNWYNLGSAITAANGVVSALVNTAAPAKCVGMNFTASVTGGGSISGSVVPYLLRRARLDSLQTA